ncbi:MAG: Hint domain-containing protein [Clostridia bacterium]|nr:Hint domain-containing protein [Clostridia bacterium]
MNKNKMCVRAQSNAQKGITLIAIIITIIVMLILVATTINLAINGGLFEKAGQAVREMQNAINYEQELANGRIKADGIWYDSVSDYIKGIPSENQNGVGEDEETITISFDFEEVTIVKGGTATITPNVSTAKEVELVWKSSNDEILSVSNGTVNAKENGIVTLKCSLKGNEKVFATCTINIKDGSEVYAKAEEENSLTITFKEIPSDCTLRIKCYYRGISSDAGHIKNMQGLRDADPIATIANNGTIEGGFYTDYYYQLKDQYGNLSDYFWFYPGFACFVKGTEISTPNGIKNIEDIKVGDKVYTMNMNTYVLEEKEVVQIFNNKVKYNVVKIYTQNDCIECTTGHRIYTKNRGWTEAYYLQENDILIDSSNKEIAINKIEKLLTDEELTVYNFEVEDNHNYFVGEDKILVHNPPEPSYCNILGETYVGTSIGK